MKKTHTTVIAGDAGDGSHSNTLGLRGFALRFRKNQTPVLPGPRFKLTSDLPRGFGLSSQRKDTLPMKKLMP